MTSSLRKFYGSQNDVADSYGIFISQMATHMFVSRNHYPLRSLFMTCNWVCNKSNRTDVTSGSLTA